MSRARRVYQVLTRLLPRDLRLEAGNGLADAAVEQLRRARIRGGKRAVARAWLVLTWDLLTTAVLVRRRSAAALPDGRESLIALNPRRGRGGLEAMMDNTRQDLRYALRALWRQPGFTAVTVITLALGIGANTAVFSVLNGVVLRPLAYPGAQELVFITSQFPDLQFDRFWVSPPEFLEFRDHNRAFQSVGAYSVGAVNLGTDSPSRPVTASVSPELFPTLGVAPLTGRGFSDADTLPGAERVVVLSSELWQRQFGRAPDVLGRTVLVDNRPARVVGIMPAGFDVHDEHVELWAPLTIDPATLANRRGNHFLYLIGRRKPEVTMDAARADVARLVQDWRTLVPAGHVPSGERHPMRAEPLKEDLVGGIRPALLLMQGAVGFVLLIACANLANLLVARADTRRREYAVRSAIGASRARLFQQLLTEGLVLSVAAAIVGAGLAALGLRVLMAINVDAIPRAAEVALDGTVLAFSLAVAAVTAVIFGLVPLLHLGKGDGGEALRDSAGRSATGTARAGFRSTLVVAEVALAVLLVAGAGLLMRSFVNLLRVDLGFSRSQLATFSVVLSGGYDGQRRVQFYTQLAEKVGAIAGIQSVGLVSGLPPLRRVDANDTNFEHIPDNRPAGALPVENVDFWQATSLGFIETVGLPVIEGRAFQRSDLAGGPVVLVNQELVRRFFPDRGPLGQRVRLGDGETPWFTIVGVVADMKLAGVDANPGTQLYLLNDQLGDFSYSQMHVVARSPLPLTTLAPAFRRAVADLDPSLPVIEPRTMDEVVDAAVAQPRFLTMLLGVFAGLALLLAAVGTYGILSYLVTERRQELGIRMALGASRQDVLKLVLGRGLLLSGVGLVVGLAASLGLSRVLSSLLFGVSPTDPATLAGVAGLIAVVATGASLIPALRATRVDPLRVLRQG